MPLFVANEKTCNRCGICAESCPAKIIEFKVPGLPPTPVTDAAASCISCGHCVTICPQEAMTHQKMAPEQCPPVQQQLLLTPESAEHFLRARRSIRNYKNESVPQESLAKLLEIVSYAPTGHNSQSINWHIVYNREDVHRLGGLVIDWMRQVLEKTPEQAKAMNMDRLIEAWDKGIDRICRSAPHLIIAHAEKQDRFAPLSVPIATTYLELAAPTFGLGTCWGGYFNAAAQTYAPLQEALGLPDGHKCFGVLMLGVPKYSYKKLPLRNKPQVSWA